MKEYHLFYAPGLPADSQLPADEAGHAVRVLRMKEGDELLATDGKGHFYECTITVASQKRVMLNIEHTTEGPHYWRGRIHLAVAPTKNMDRMEWLAEKATEIGLDQLTFLNCKNSERRVVKTERVERIVVSATKQSHKAWKPEVAEMTPLKTFIAQPRNGEKFIAHCHEEYQGPFLADVAPHEGDATILIGPEGDFSIEEVETAIAAGYKPVSLGQSRLRTETAALAAVHILQIQSSR